jgi:hypothetical protein
MQGMNVDFSLEARLKMMLSPTSGPTNVLIKLCSKKPTVNMSKQFCRDVGWIVQV